MSKAFVTDVSWIEWGLSHGNVWRLHPSQDTSPEGAIGLMLNLAECWWILSPLITLNQISSSPFWSRSGFVSTPYLSRLSPIRCVYRTWPASKGFGGDVVRGDQRSQDSTSTPRWLLRHYSVFNIHPPASSLTGSMIGESSICNWHIIGHVVSFDRSYYPVGQ